MYYFHICPTRLIPVHIYYILVTYGVSVKHVIPNATAARRPSAYRLRARSGDVKTWLE